MADKLSKDIITAEGEFDSSQFQREERFTSIEPGQYWEVKKLFTTSDFYKTKVKEGLVLLILDVDLVDGSAHTVKINFHPSWGSGYLEMRIQDFINHFIPCLDPEEVRNREILEIQGTISEKQAALNEAMANPALLQGEIEEQLLEWEEKNKPESSTSTALVAPGNVSLTPGSLISAKASSQDVDAMVYQAKKHAQIISLHSGAIQKRASELSKLVQSITPYMTEKADAMVARSKNAMKRVEGIMKGVQSLSLYVGEGVVVSQLLDGESAPPDEKPRIMQAKLFMNEELAVFADVSERFDFNSIPQFDKMLSEPGFVQQILPYPRCVASMAVRRDNLNYGEPFLSAYNNAVNKSVFLLIRDGDKVYRIHSAEPSHENARRLFPTRQEIDSIFRSWDKEITFESLQYTKALKKHEINALHYKRFMILLCGLDHRLKLLGSFYPEMEAMNFMTPEFQEKYLEFVRDDDPDYVIENSRPDVMDWIKENNKLVQSGSRIAFIPRKIINAETAPSCRKESYDSRAGRTHIDVVAEPTNKFEVTVVARQGDELVTFTEVKRESYRSDLSRPIFNARIKIEAKDTNFLCLDGVRSEDLDYYIYNRRARIQSSSFIQLFKIASKTLKAEEDFQAETEEFLLKSARDAGVTDSLDVVRTAIRQWRCTKKGALLPAKDDLVALTPILDQIHTLSSGSDDVTARVEEFVKMQGIDAIRLVVTGRNHIVLYAETPESERTKVIDHHWVDRHVLRLGKTKVGITSTSKFWNTGKQENKEKVLHEWKEFPVNEYWAPCSFDDLNIYAEVIKGGVEFLERGVISPEEYSQIVSEVRAINYANKSGYVLYPKVTVPLASFVIRGELRFIYVEASYTDFVRYFGNESQVADIEAIFVGQFRDKTSGQRRFSAPIQLTLCAGDPQKSVLHVHKDNSGLKYSIGQASLSRRRSYDVGAGKHLDEPEFEGDNEIEKMFDLLTRRIREGELDAKNLQVFSPMQFGNIASKSSMKL